MTEWEGALWPPRGLTGRPVYPPSPGGPVCAGMIGVRGSRQPTVDSPRRKREEPERKSEKGLTAETLSAQRSERREEPDLDFDTEVTEVRGAEVAEKVGQNTELGCGVRTGDQELRGAEELGLVGVAERSWAACSWAKREAASLKAGLSLPNLGL